MITKKQVVNTFIDLVTIDSPSSRERKVSDYIIKYLKKLKIKAGRDAYGNVIAKAHGYGEPFLLAAHMDTAEPGCGIKPVIKKDFIRSDGATILGADDKAGIAAILEAVSYLKKKKIQHRNLELVFTREGEIGGVGAIKLGYKRLKAKEGIVVDSSRPLGCIILAEPFVYSIEAVVKGRGVYFGANLEKGINAIQIAAKAISEMKLGKINKYTICNVGIIQGGTAISSVPDKTLVKAEVRSHNIGRAQELVDLMNKIFKKHVRRRKASLSFKAKLIFRGYRHPRNDALVKKITECNHAQGIKTAYELSAAASEVSIYNQKKIKTVGISFGGAHSHTTKERIKKKELVKLTRFLVEFLKK